MRLLKQLFLFCIGVFSFLSADASMNNLNEPQITPSAGPRVQDGADVLFTADILYWHASQQNLLYAFSAPIDNSELVGSVFSPNYQFDGGFQLGFGLQLGHDGWDIYANYTWYHPESEGNSFADDPDIDLSYHQARNFRHQFESGKINYHLELDVIDFEIARNYFISQYLALRPFVGLKTAWNRMHSKQYFKNASHLYEIYSKQNAFEIGPRTGVNVHYDINSNWSIFLNTAFSALAESCKSHVRTINHIDADNANVIANIADDQNLTQPVVELGAGIEWDIWSDSEEYHLGVCFGWDFQYWNNNLYLKDTKIDTNDELVYETYRRVGDLSIQGLNIKFRFDF